MRKLSSILDEYEKEFIGINLLNYSKYIGQWFYHDYQFRLHELTTLVFPWDEEKFSPGDGGGFANLVPLVLAEV